MVVVVVPIGFRYQSGRFAGGRVVPTRPQRGTASVGMLYLVRLNLGV